MFHSNRKLFQKGRRIIWISPVRHRVSGKPARPPAESPCLESLCPGKQLCSAMAAGENALTSRSLLCRPLVQKPLTKLPWPEMAHTRKVRGTQQNLEWMAAALLMRCNHLGCWFLFGFEMNSKCVRLVPNVCLCF